MAERSRFMSPNGFYKPKTVKSHKKRGKLRGPIKRKPSYQRRHMMKNISQSIQAHINRLAQPVVRNPMSESPFAFLSHRLMDIGRQTKSVKDQVPKVTLRPLRKLKKKKGKRSLKKKSRKGRSRRLETSNDLIIPAQLSESIATFEKARLNFLESLTQIRQQISRLRLPKGLSEQCSTNKVTKKPSTKLNTNMYGMKRPKTVVMREAPPPTKGMPPRPGTPTGDNHSNSIQQIFGPKLRQLLSKTGDTSLSTWGT